MSQIAELDFSRYAPERSRPAVVWCHADSPSPGELTILAGHARGAFGLIGRCVVLTLIIIWRRIQWRVADFCRHVLHSPEAAWTVAGVGWGAGITFPLILFLMR